MFLWSSWRRTQGYEPSYNSQADATPETRYATRTGGTRWLADDHIDVEVDDWSAFPTQRSEYLHSKRNGRIREVSYLWGKNCHGNTHLRMQWFREAQKKLGNVCLLPSPQIPGLSNKEEHPEHGQQTKRLLTSVIRLDKSFCVSDRHSRNRYDGYFRSFGAVLSYFCVSAVLCVLILSEPEAVGVLSDLGTIINLLQLFKKNLH